MTQKSVKGNRGSTLLEILIAIALLLIIFLFLTADLLQSSHAENISATRSESLNAANYLLGVMRDDAQFWNGPDWAAGPGGGGQTDPCGNPWPAYTDKMTSPTWHPAPACTPSGSNPGLFPELANLAKNNHFQFMWNAQTQAADPFVATLTVWVQIDENGQNIYELQSTKTHLVQKPAPKGSIPTPTPTPTVTKTPCTGVCSSPSIKPTATPKPSPSATIKPSPTPKPSPSPQGTFE